MPPWPALIVFAVLFSCAVVIVAGYVRGNRSSRPEARPPSSAEPAEDPLTAMGSIQPGWDEKAAHTDSWIWR